MGESQVFTSAKSLRSRLDSESNNSTVGFLPTMGALHHGHLELVKQALQENTHVVVSIFVNPTQFNKAEDLESYPRDLEADLKLLNSVGDVIVFAPSVEEVYPEDYQNLSIDLGALGTSMEGEFRPGHFAGVMNVVNRLFDIVQPTRAYFGIKDVQQVAVVQYMVDQVQSPVEIVPSAIVREPSGLASSSRNYRLNEDQLNEALIIIDTLHFARGIARQLSPQETKVKAIEFFKNGSLEIEYFEIVHPRTLEFITEWVPGARACIVGYCGEVRLLDNLELIPSNK